MEFTVEMIIDGFVSTVKRLNFVSGKSLASTEISVSIVCLGIMSKNELYVAFLMITV